MRIALIQNRESGSGEAGRVEAVLASLGADVVAFAVDRARDAGDCGADRIAVAGGDGSIGCAAEAAAAADVPLAVIATGTANDLAGHLELPTALDEACRLAVEGTEIERIDLARASGRPFVNAAGAGLPPAAAEQAADMKERLGPLAYPLGALSAGAGAEPIRCSVEVDGATVFSGDAWQASVAASGAFGAGASFNADPSDGELDVIAIEAGSRARLVKHAFGLRIGEVESQEGVHSARGRGIVMRVDPGEKLNIDGEIVTAGELDPAGEVSFAVAGGFGLIVG